MFAQNTVEAIEEKPSKNVALKSLSHTASSNYSGESPSDDVKNERKMIKMNIYIGGKLFDGKYVSERSGSNKITRMLGSANVPFPIHRSDIIEQSNRLYQSMHVYQETDFDIENDT